MAIRSRLLYQAGEGKKATKKKKDVTKVKHSYAYHIESRNLVSKSHGASDRLMNILPRKTVISIFNGETSQYPCEKSVS